MPSVLSVRGISRQFPGVIALDGVSLEVEAGQVHGLVGENGAGKSTLINIISGVLRPDSGEMILGGAPVTLPHPVAARQLGIVTVHQEADLFSSLSVAENMALQTGLPTGPLGLVRWREVYARARRAVAPLGEDFDIRQPASRLSVAHRHLSQVAAALEEKARLVILDEPTSVLTLSETEWLFAQIERMRQSGVGVIYISHRQEEIFRLADRITVLRDGRNVWSGPTATIDSAGLVQQMIGRTMELPTRPPRTATKSSAPMLSVSGFTDRQQRFRDVSLEVAAGEVLGIYGLVGSGRTELAHALFGLAPAQSGTLAINGERVVVRRPADAVRAGMAYVPEDRLRQAVCRGLSIRENGMLAALAPRGRHLFVRERTETRTVAEQVERFRVRLRSLEDPIEQLSGGNQQKVILARWVINRPKVLILDEPTRGVDVAAKAEIHRIIRQLADDGAAVVMISSEIPEILAHSDRIGVFREGRLVRVMEGEGATAIDIAESALPKEAAHVPGELRRGERKIGARPWTGIGLALATVALGMVLTATTEGRFLDPDNLWNLASNLAPRAMLALAAATVIIAGGIDISIGSLLALAAAVGGMTMTRMGIVAGIASGLAVATLGGVINGAVSVLGGVHPIVVTLGTMAIYRGVLIVLTGSGVVSGLPDAFGALATDRWLGLPGSVWMLLVVTIACHFWLTHFRSGRYLYAVGTSPSAARLVGISRTRVGLLAFTVAGLLVGCAGMLELAQNRTMQPTMGVGYELRAIAAAVIGGVAIEGGRGNVAGVLLGSLLLLMIENGLVLWQVSGAKYDLVIGSLLLAAILLDRLVRRVER